MQHLLNTLNCCNEMKNIMPSQNCRINSPLKDPDSGGIGSFLLYAYLIVIFILVRKTLVCKEEQKETEKGFIQCK